MRTRQPTNQRVPVRRPFETTDYQPRRDDCIYGPQHRYNLAMCKQCSLDVVRRCVYSAYRPLNYTAGHTHDDWTPLTIDEDRYLLDPDSGERLVNPVTYRTIKVVDLSAAFANVRMFYGYASEDEGFAPIPRPDTIQDTQ